MLPGFLPGSLVIGWKPFNGLKAGQVVVLKHDGKEKIKRIDRIEGRKLYVLGDNLARSTDSRTFGWVDRADIIARIVWPRRQHVKVQ